MHAACCMHDTGCRTHGAGTTAALFVGWPPSSSTTTLKLHVLNLGPCFPPLRTSSPGTSSSLKGKKVQISLVDCKWIVLLIYRVLVIAGERKYNGDEEGDRGLPMIAVNYHLGDKNARAFLERLGTCTCTIAFNKYLNYLRYLCRSTLGEARRAQHTKAAGIRSCPCSAPSHHGARRAPAHVCLQGIEYVTVNCTWNSFRFY